MLLPCFMQLNTCYLFVKSYENHYSIWIKTEAGEDLQFLPFSCCWCWSRGTLLPQPRTVQQFSQHHISFPLYAYVLYVYGKIRVCVFAFLCVCVNYNLIMNKCCTVLVDSVQAWEPGMLGELIAKLCRPKFPVSSSGFSHISMLSVWFFWWREYKQLLLTLVS